MNGPFVELYGPFTLEERIPYYDPNKPKSISASAPTIIQTGIVLLIVLAWFTLIRDWFFSYNLPDNTIQKKDYVVSTKIQFFFSIFFTAIAVGVILLVRIFFGGHI